ncbi:MAG: AAA-like domain-containing protein, partial [Chloroflexota bacterium]
MNRSQFFKNRGSLTPNFPSYVERPADNELLWRLSLGQFCYILTCRQMGKTSLIKRAAETLRQQHTRTVIIDLNEIGHAPIDKWYATLLHTFKKQLNLTVDLRSWWQAQTAHLGYVPAFINFLHDILLAEIEQEQIVIFIDEIEAILDLDFSDDFFAAIRAIYESRSTKPAFERLTFVIVGGAAPTDLIKDRRRTTFNIAYPVELGELERHKAKLVFQKGLQDVCPGQEGQIVDKIFDWTQGHPYLTQTLAQAVTETEQECQADQVDEIVNQMFLSKAADLQDDINLQTVNRYITLIEPAKRRRLLRLYRRVYTAKGGIKEDPNSIDQNQLKVFGLVRSQRDQGVLIVKNNIYQQVFDKAWIKANTPIDWGRRLVVALVVVVIFLISFIGVIGYAIYQQSQQTVEQQAQLILSNFQETGSADVRLTSLANLFELPGYEAQARELFFDDTQLPPDERIALFTDADALAVEAPLTQVIKGTYLTLENNPHHNQLLQVMAAALRRGSDSDTVTLLSIEITQWQAGRYAHNQGRYASAITAYDVALQLNPNNASIYLDRALAHAANQDNASALTDFEFILLLDEGMQSRVLSIIDQQPNLYQALWNNRANYTTLAALMVTPTSTYTPSPSDTPAPTHTPTLTPLPTETATASPTPSPTPTIVPTEPSSTPNPSPTPISSPPFALNGEQAYNRALALALAWQPDAALQSMSPTLDGPLQADGTATRWRVQFWSESAGTTANFLYENGAFQAPSLVSSTEAPRVIPSLNVVSFDTKTFADTAAREGGQAYLDAGAYLLPWLTPYPLDIWRPTWYYNYFHPDHSVALSVIIDARNGEVIDKFVQQPADTSAVDVADVPPQTIYFN